MKVKMNTINKTNHSPYLSWSVDWHLLSKSGTYRSMGHCVQSDLKAPVSIHQYAIRYALTYLGVLSPWVWTICKSRNVEMSCRDQHWLGGTWSITWRVNKSKKHLKKCTYWQIGFCIVEDFYKSHQAAVHTLLLKHIGWWFSYSADKMIYSFSENSANRKK